MMMMVNVIMFATFITGAATAQKAFTPTGSELAFEVTGERTAARPATASAGVEAKSNKDIKAMKANLKAEKINLRVNKNLQKNYKDASGVDVSHESRAIVARFKTSDDKAARVVYNKNGGWLYTIFTYNEDKLPTTVKDMVVAAYPNFNITLVQEIKQGDITIHKVFLEDCTSFKQVLVHNDELTLYEDFKKSK